MSESGHHATESAERAKSALPSLSEIRAALQHFGFVPGCDIRMAPHMPTRSLLPPQRIGAFVAKLRCASEPISAIAMPTNGSPYLIEKKRPGLVTLEDCDLLHPEANFGRLRICVHGNGEPTPINPSSPTPSPDCR